MSEETRLARLDQKSRDAIEMVDALRRRGAIEVEIHEAGVVRAKFAAPLGLPSAPPRPAKEIPHRDAADCNCEACLTAFGSAD